MSISGTLHTLRNVPGAYKHLRLSFSQYGEDLILPHMGAQNRGFYVDVGAYQPRSKSNTYKLYLKGWSGITIEPNPDVATSFKRVRPRDTHLSIGISNFESELVYYKFAEANCNSFAPEWAERFKVQEKVPIKCLPLTNVLDQYCRNQHIDLLSVDCEGHDMEVLQSLDWARYRPTVVIIEDFAAFSNGSLPSGSSPIRSFMIELKYALASQTVFSSFYVDRLAFGSSDRDSGFRLDHSQLRRLA